MLLYIFGFEVSFVYAISICVKKVQGALTCVHLPGGSVMLLFHLR